MDELKNYRKKIDFIDGKILLMLKKRFDVVEKIGEAKARLRLPVRDAKRLRELFRDRARTAEKYGLPKKLAAKIFRDIVDSSMERERKSVGRSRE